MQGKGNQCKGRKYDRRCGAICPLSPGSATTTFDLIRHSDGLAMIRPIAPSMENIMRAVSNARYTNGGQRRREAVSSRTRSGSTVLVSTEAMKRAGGEQRHRTARSKGYKKQSEVEQRTRRHNVDYCGASAVTANTGNGGRKGKQGYPAPGKVL